MNRIDTKFYKKIMEQARDIILVVHTDGRIIDVNHAAIDAYGYSIEELSSLRVHDLRAPETYAIIDTQLKNAQQNGSLFRTMHLRRSGERFPVEVSSQRVRLTDEDVIVSIVRDITESVAMENDLRESEAKFRRINEELTAAHEELTASEEELRQQFDELLANQEQIMRSQEALQTSEAKYRAIFEAVNDGIYVHDLETGDILDVNETACNLYGYTRDEIIAGNFDVIGTGEAIYSEKEARQWVMRAATEKPQLFEWLNKRKDGTRVWVEINLKRAAIGSEDRILAIVRDISDRKNNEFELQKSQANNQALINAIPDSLFIMKRDGTLMDYRANKEQSLVSPNFLGKTVLEIFPEEIAIQMLQSIEKTIETGDIQVFEYQLSIHDKVKHYEARIVTSGEEEIMAIVRNITERVILERQLKQLSLHDALTGLYNRAFFEEAMKRLDGGYDHSGGIAVFDVDGLKIVNDTLGHDTGDEVIKAVAGILRNSFRQGDLAARIGGDEFAVLLSENSAQSFEELSRRVREMVVCYNEKNSNLPISLSMGFAAITGAPIDMKAVFKEADNNMYREKLHRQKSTHSSLVRALMKALEARDFITEGHGDRLQDLMEPFAIFLGLPESSIPDLRLLARFHDIGKVGIPDNILFKPGSLTEEEFAVMRRHCEIGCRIAKSAPDLLPIADWILKHQEWWDGQGYPLGIRGEDIPLECRMLGIVDAFDAMISDRPYRKAMDKSMAIIELRRCAGTQFDLIW